MNNEPYRNHYISLSDDHFLQLMVDRGFAKKGQRLNDNLQIYHITDRGVEIMQVYAGFELGSMLYRIFKKSNNE